jgi:hypothetical protein
MTAFRLGNFSLGQFRSWKDTTRSEEQRTANSRYPKDGFSCSKDSFVVNQALEF